MGTWILRTILRVREAGGNLDLTYHTASEGSWWELGSYVPYCE